ncbi:MAG TPA: hypothetical protein VG674_01365 [Amycolatopsis sp.]|nr:hypothetical protein [Amycolatopsis sp.]
MLAQVDEQRNARTNAAFKVAVDEWLKVHELEETPRETYGIYARTYLFPATSRSARSQLVCWSSSARSSVAAGHAVMVDHPSSTAPTASTNAAW